MVNSIPSSANPFWILTIAFIRMSTTVKVYLVWHSGTVLTFTRTLSAVWTTVLIHDIQKHMYITSLEVLLAFSLCVSWRSSVMHLIFIQIENAQTQLLCNYNWQFWDSLPAAQSSFHKLQACDSKIQYSCLFPGYVMPTVMWPILQ